MEKILDIHAFWLAAAVLAETNLATVRERSLASLKRWKDAGTWCAAYDEWRVLMQSGNDADMMAMMTGTDSTAIRLRQFPPYSGILDLLTVRRIWDSTKLLAEQFTVDAVDLLSVADRLAVCAKQTLAHR